MSNNNPQIEQVNLDLLIPYVNNSRTHSEEQISQIASSIKEFGFTNPVLVDNQNGIIAGHGRVLASKKLGLKTVPCIRLSNLSEAQKKAYIIADNKLALNAGWDNELLKIELTNIEDLGLSKDITGFVPDELKQIFYVPQLVEEESVIFNGEERFRAPTPVEFKKEYDASTVRQIILIYDAKDYDAVVDAMAEHADKFGLSNNTEVVNHLLETNGYPISSRQL
jgi:hypothetical protein